MSVQSLITRFEVIDGDATQTLASASVSPQLPGPSMITGVKPNLKDLINKTVLLDLDEEFTNTSKALKLDSDQVADEVEQEFKRDSSISRDNSDSKLESASGRSNRQSSGSLTGRNDTILPVKARNSTYSHKLWTSQGSHIETPASSVKNEGTNPKLSGSWSFNSNGRDSGYFEVGRPIQQTKTGDGNEEDDDYDNENDGDDNLVKYLDIINELYLDCDETFAGSESTPCKPHKQIITADPETVTNQDTQKDTMLKVACNSSENLKSEIEKGPKKPALIRTQMQEGTPISSANNSENKSPVVPNKKLSVDIDMQRLDLHPSTDVNANSSNLTIPNNDREDVLILNTTEGYKIFESNARNGENASLYQESVYLEPNVSPLADKPKKCDPRKSLPPIPFSFIDEILITSESLVSNKKGFDGTSLFDNSVYDKLANTPETPFQAGFPSSPVVGKLFVSLAEDFPAPRSSSNKFALLKEIKPIAFLSPKPKSKSDSSVAKTKAPSPLSSEEVASYDNKQSETQKLLKSPKSEMPSGFEPVNSLENFSPTRTKDFKPIPPVHSRLSQNDNTHDDNDKPTVNKTSKKKWLKIFQLILTMAKEKAFHKETENVPPPPDSPTELILEHQDNVDSDTSKHSLDRMKSYKYRKISKEMIGNPCFQSTSSSSMEHSAFAGEFKDRPSPKVGGDYRFARSDADLFADLITMNDKVELSLNETDEKSNDIKALRKSIFSFLSESSEFSYTEEEVNNFLSMLDAKFAL